MAWLNGEGRSIDGARKLQAANRQRRIAKQERVTEWLEENAAKYPFKEAFHICKAEFDVGEHALRRAAKEAGLVFKVYERETHEERNKVATVWLRCPWVQPIYEGEV